MIFGGSPLLQMSGLGWVEAARLAATAASQEPTVRPVNRLLETFRAVDGNRQVGLTTAATYGFSADGDMTQTIHSGFLTIFGYFSQ
jgi:hypothetical protein